MLVTAASFPATRERTTMEPWKTTRHLLHTQGTRREAGFARSGKVSPSPQSMNTCPGMHARHRCRIKQHSLLHAAFFGQRPIRVTAQHHREGTSAYLVRVLVHNNVRAPESSAFMGCSLRVQLKIGRSTALKRQLIRGLEPVVKSKIGFCCHK